MSATDLSPCKFSYQGNICKLWYFTKNISDLIAFFLNICLANTCQYASHYVSDLDKT